MFIYIKQNLSKENETQKILLYFEIQTDPLIPTKRPDRVLIHKVGKWGTSNTLPYWNTADSLIPTKRPDRVFIYIKQNLSKENKVQKILLYFEIQLDHLIPTKRPVYVFIYMKQNLSKENETQKIPLYF